jgi:hypothetical protein
VAALSTRRASRRPVLPPVLPFGFVAREKRSVSLPADLARSIEAAATAEGTTFSAWLAETAAHRLRLDAGQRAVAEWEREHGSLSAEELADGLARARSLLGREPNESATGSA